MKTVRILSLILPLCFVLSLFCACSNGVPDPYGSDEVLAEALIHTKVVVLEEDEENKDAEPTENLLMEKDITVTSTTKPALSIKDLINTMLDEGHVSGQLVYTRIASLSGYDADDTHMWFWSLNGNPDLPLGSQIKQDDTVVFTYASKTADLTTDEEGNVITAPITLTIDPGDGTPIYDGEYIIEGSKSASVKEILKTMREAGTLDYSGAGYIKSINTYKAENGMAWHIYIDGEIAKPSAKVREESAVRIVYESAEITAKTDDAPAEEAPAEE